MSRRRKHAESLGIRIPAPATVAKYGWTEEEWLTMLESQGWVCPICGKLPKAGRMVTDHEHVRGWAAMPDHERKLYVRGITCWTCNRYLLARGISIAVAENTAQYLRNYLARRPR